MKSTTPKGVDFSLAVRYLDRVVGRAQARFRTPVLISPLDTHQTVWLHHTDPKAISWTTSEPQQLLLPF